MIKSGSFITFEGGEGAGKTTLINRLAASLTNQGKKVITTREPGGTSEAESIRRLLVQRDAGEWSPLSEVLLLYAARSLHIDRVIQPALDNGHIVISDRFTDSTVAYQGYGRGMSLEKIQEIDQVVTGGLKPDVTFILDVDVKIGLERSQKRLSVEKGYSSTEDRFERMDISFHESLRAGFLEIAKSEPERCHVINAEEPLDDMFNTIQNIVKKHYV